MTKKYVERWDAGCDSRPLLEEADREMQRLQVRINGYANTNVELRAEIAALKHDNERLMKSLNAEVNAHEPGGSQLTTELIRRAQALAAPQPRRQATQYNEFGVPTCDCIGRPVQHGPDCPIGRSMKSL